MSVPGIIIALLVMLALLMAMKRLFGQPSSRHSTLGCLGVLAVFLVVVVLIGSTAVLVVWRRAASLRPFGAKPRAAAASVDHAPAPSARASMEMTVRGEAPAGEDTLAGGDATPNIDLDPEEDTSGEPSPEPKLSPSRGVVIPPGRPDWVESEPVETGGVHTWPVSSGVQISRQACRRALDEKLELATAEYLERVVLDRANAAARLGYDFRYIRTNLLRPENIYHEIIQTSVGPVHQSHALLEFDRVFRQESEERWRQLRATSRLLQTGLVAALVLGVVAAFFGYFRLDTATRGFYTRRLQLAAAIAILALIATGVLLARWTPWI